MKNLLDYLILIADKTLAADIDKAISKLPDRLSNIDTKTYNLVKKDINTLKKLVDDTARNI